MTESFGLITSDDRLKITRWLDEKVKNHSCPLCNTNNWMIGDHIVTCLPFSAKGVGIGGASYPMVMLACVNCYFVRHFMAVPMGLSALMPKVDSSDDK